MKSLRSSNSPRGGRGGQLFPLLPSTSIEANKQETAFEAPIWEINKISSEILDKLECGKFETKRGGGVLWGLVGVEQQQCSPEMGEMKDSALRPFSLLTSAVGFFKIHTRFAHLKSVQYLMKS